MILFTDPPRFAEDKKDVIRKYDECKALNNWLFLTVLLIISGLLILLVLLYCGVRYAVVIDGRKSKPGEIPIIL